MIKKERLQELIEQNATIYFLAPTNEIIEIHCNNNAFIGCYDNMFHFRNNYYNIDANFTSLFETKEDAEWHKEFGCIERTERLDLPTWEEFWNSGQTIWFIGKDGGQYGLSQYNRTILLNDEYVGYLDKESYIKACRKCKALFLGENYEN